MLLNIFDLLVFIESLYLYFIIIYLGFSKNFIFYLDLQSFFAVLWF
jgi:hypothetical protein